MNSKKKSFKHKPFYQAKTTQLRVHDIDVPGASKSKKSRQDGLYYDCSHNKIHYTHVPWMVQGNNRKVQPPFKMRLFCCLLFSCSSRRDRTLRYFQEPQKFILHHIRRIRLSPISPFSLHALGHLRALAFCTIINRPTPAPSHFLSLALAFAV
jgi:hypothetical protein